MRRTVPVLAATAGAIALLAAFHTTSPSTGLVVGTGSTTSGPVATEPPTTVGDGSPTTAGTDPPVSTTTAVRTIDGPVVDTRYGPVQVRVTLRGHRLEDVEALVLPSDRARSQRISQQAGPLLRREALQAQSANIYLVSGASYTSQGYATSLQGALDRADG